MSFTDCDILNTDIRPQSQNSAVIRTILIQNMYSLRNSSALRWKYLGGLVRLEFPYNLSLLCDTFIEARRRRRRGRGGGGVGRGNGSRGRSRGRRSGRGLSRFVILTRQLFKLSLESEELLHGTVDLFLIPSTKPVCCSG